MVWATYQAESGFVSEDRVALKLGFFNEELISAAGGRNLDFESLFAEYNGTEGVTFDNITQAVYVAQAHAKQLLPEMLADVDWLIDGTGYAYRKWPGACKSTLAIPSTLRHAENATFALETVSIRCSDSGRRKEAVSLRAFEPVPQLTKERVRFVRQLEAQTMPM